MNPKKTIKLKYLLCILCIIALFSLAAYFFISASPLQEKKEDTWADSGFQKVGHHLTIRNTDNQLFLLDSKDVLSADGLYYAAWAMGDFKPYENSDGETVELYDAQLYLVLAESKKSEEASNNVTKWLDAARKNYEILTEEEISCNGLSYQLVTYHCIGEDNPYDRGISAFGVWDDTAVCAELTCVKEFGEDLRDVLIHFLDNCSYE